MLWNIKKEMADAGLTMAGMASLLGISANTFSWKLNEKKGREFDLSELAAMAELFGRPIDYLVAERTPPVNKPGGGAR